jgi:hypothetical protein
MRKIRSKKKEQELQAIRESNYEGVDYDEFLYMLKNRMESY